MDKKESQHAVGEGHALEPLFVNRTLAGLKCKNCGRTYESWLDLDGVDCTKP